MQNGKSQNGCFKKTKDAKFSEKQTCGSGMWHFNRCCLIHISIILPRHFLYLLYFCPCLDIGLFVSYLCGLFFIFIFIFTDIILLLLTFQNMYYCFCMITWMKNVNNFQIAKVQPQGVAQHLPDFLPILVWHCL